jgi:hypothetical protein
MQAVAGLTPGFSIGYWILKRGWMFILALFFFMPLPAGNSLLPGRRGGGKNMEKKPK